MRLLVDVILFLTGLVLGNWFAIERDKRKEFNEVADQVQFALKKQKETIENGRAVKRGPEDKDLEKLKRRISFFKKTNFKKALREYKKVTSGDNWNMDEYGSTSYDNPQKVIDAINELMKYTSRK